MSAQCLRGREAFGVRPLAGALASRPASQSRTGSVRSLIAAAMSRMRTGDCEPADGGPVLKAVVTAGRGSVRSPFVRQAVRLDGRAGPGCGTHTAAASRRSPCAAATPHGAFDFAKRLECARLRALLKSPTAPGNLLPRPYLSGPCHTRPHPLPARRPLPSEGRLRSRPGDGWTRTGDLRLKTTKPRT